MALRRSNGLPDLPPPDLAHQDEVEELYVLEPEFARPFLVGGHEPALGWHAAGLFQPDRPRSILTHALLLVERSVCQVCAASADRVLLFELRRKAMNALTLEMPAPGLATIQRNGIARAEPPE